MKEQHRCRKGDKEQLSRQEKVGREHMFQTNCLPSSSHFINLFVFFFFYIFLREKKKIFICHSY